jgi:hypothetical protein
LRKVIFILFLIIFSSGCYVTKITGNRNSDASNKLSDNIFETIKEQNITNNSFFIQKAEIQVISQSGTEKLIGSIRFKNPDKYLISLRSRTGIEAARIYISDDTILVNDRINRKLYFGSSFYLFKKYGFKTTFLPLIFGDLIINKYTEANKERGTGDKLNIDCLVNGILIKYDIDYEKRKTTFTCLENSLNENGINISYENFKKSGDILLPGKIKINNLLKNTLIEIKIIKAELKWSGNIEFIPGKGYELIKLL